MTTGLKCFFGLIILPVALVGCAESRPLSDPPLAQPESRIFDYNYDEAWRAIQLAVRRYPVHVNNIDSGILETDFVQGDKIFADPSENKTKASSRYKIIIRAVKDPDDSSAIKVTCTKISQVQKDFFVGYLTSPSNGLEEKAILYRVGRYLDMDRMLSEAR